jgi:hypothetical protein
MSHDSDYGPEMDAGDLWFDDYPSEVWCAACGAPTRVVEIDNGIGAYEYWGAVGYHTDIHPVSECCEDDYLDYKPVGDEDAPDDNLINESEVA